MKVFALYEGSFSVDASKKFVPFDPAADAAQSRKGSLFVHIYPFLVETHRDLILLDSGLGECDENGEPQLFKHIRAHGYHESDVSKVIMSHLHKDHALGLLRTVAGDYHLNFPGVPHYIQRSEMETATSAGTSSYQATEMRFIRDNAELVLLDGDSVIQEGIRVEVSGGHCPAHQVIYIDSGSDFYFYGGDELPETSALIHNYIAKYDFDGRKSRDLRIKYGNQAAEEGWTCLFYHDNDSRPLARVGKNVDGSFKVISRA